MKNKKNIFRPSHLNLSHNLLSGPPMPLSSLPNLASIDLSHNRLGAATQVYQDRNKGKFKQFVHIKWIYKTNANTIASVQDELSCFRSKCSLNMWLFIGQIFHANKRSIYLNKMRFLFSQNVVKKGETMINSNKDNFQFESLNSLWTYFSFEKVESFESPPISLQALNLRYKQLCFFSNIFTSYWIVKTFSWIQILACPVAKREFQT